MSDSRTRLLDAGLNLVAERMTSPIENVEAIDVITRTGLTSSDFDQNWQNKQAYHDDLRVHLDEAWALTSLAVGFVDAASVVDGDRATAILHLFRQEVGRDLAEPRWWLELAMIAGGHSKDIAASLTHMEDWIGDMSAIYEQALDVFDLTIRDGCSYEWLARSLMALVNGFGLQTRAGIELDLGDDPTWNALDHAVASVVVGSVRHNDNRELPHEIRVAWHQLFGQVLIGPSLELGQPDSARP